MSDSQKRSRTNKYEKRRKNSKAISILIIVGVILAIVLLWIMLFGGTSNSTNKQEEKASGQPIFAEKDDTDTSDETSVPEDFEEDKELDDEENNNADNDNNEVELDQIESDDPNVIEAYTGNWKPIGTEQEGPHTTVYDSGSLDRIEIKEAVLSVTGLNENDLVEHWIGNDGDQKVMSTVSNEEKTEIYRVYLSWIDGEGWQPTKLEKLQQVSKGN